MCFQTVLFSQTTAAAAASSFSSQLASLFSPPSSSAAYASLPLSWPIVAVAVATDRRRWSALWPPRWTTAQRRLSPNCCNRGGLSEMVPVTVSWYVETSWCAPVMRQWLAGRPPVMNSWASLDSTECDRTVWQLVNCWHSTRYRSTNSGNFRETGARDNLVLLLYL